nr:putative integron gene cassette protein [uncultured bacterium]
METISRRYVVHLDILGMRALSARNHREAWDMLSALEIGLRKSTNSTVFYKGFDGPAHIPELVQSVVFSDTIVLYSASDSKKDFVAIFTAALKLFAEALYLRVPIRIGISKGMFYSDEERSMYAGPALIEAYEIGEASQWLGIVLSDSVAEDARNEDFRNGASRLVVDWEVPTKNGPVKASVVNWPVALEKNFKIEPPIAPEQFYQIFEEYFGPLSELREVDAAKYTNTVDFLNAQYASHKQG